MLTRRTFLLGAAGTAAGTAAGLMLPAWVRRAKAFIETEHQPLLEPPPRVRRVLQATIPDWDDRYYLVLTEPYEGPPRLTWRQFHRRYFADQYGHFADFVKEVLGEPAAPDDEADPSWVRNIWVDTADAPHFAAYHYLSQFDLGPELNNDLAVGRIEFVNGFDPGQEQRLVTVPDLLSLSLLQNRLNEIDGTTLVQL